MVFNVTFNNISVISCRSVLLVEETGVRKLLTNVFIYCCIEYTSNLNGIRTHNFSGDRH
jgi:hypothetical protein